MNFRSFLKGFASFTGDGCAIEELILDGPYLNDWQWNSHIFPLDDQGAIICCGWIMVSIKKLPEFFGM